MNKLMKLIIDNKTAEKSPIKIENKGDESSLYIYDVISSDWGVSALSVIESIARAGDAKTLNVHINSPGGDVFEGRAIMAALSAFRGKTIAKIDSLCASAATSIALSCDEVEMSDGSFFMIHNASGMAWGDKKALRDTADVLEKVEGAIVNDYIAKTGINEADIRAMMDAETWMTAQEALDNGFVDRVSEKEKVKNSWNLSAFNNTPKELIEPPEIEPIEEQQEPTLAGFFMSAANKKRLNELKLS